MDMSVVATALLVVVMLILSLTVHEFAHAWAAKRLGDDTAESMGRLNLNPLSHIDPLGTVILPMGMLMIGGIPFGWAKPVPFNPNRFRRDVSIRRGTAAVAAAGPLSNLMLALICQGVLAAAIYGGWLSQLPSALQVFLDNMVLINVVLCIFNLIPVHPLDGQKVVAGFLPFNAAISYERFTQQYGTPLLLLVIVLAAYMDLLSAPIGYMMYGVRAVFGLA